MTIMTAMTMTMTVNRNRVRNRVRQVRGLGVGSVLGILFGIPVGGKIKIYKKKINIDQNSKFGSQPSSNSVSNLVPNSVPNRFVSLLYLLGMQISNILL